MSSGADLLVDAFGRIHEGTVMVVDSLSPAELSQRIAPGANTIGWLVWHLMRVQDNHVADAAGSDEVWSSAGWHKRLGCPSARRPRVTATAATTSTRSTSPPSCWSATPRPSRT